MIFKIILTILILIVIFLLLYIAFLKLFRKHTRERFAFAGLSVVLILLISVIYHLFSAEGSINAIIDTTNYCLDAEFSSYKSDWRDTLIIMILMVSAMYFIVNIHRNWDGYVSTIHYEKLRFREQNNIYEESFLQLKDFLSKEKKIIRYVPSKNEPKYSILKGKEYEKTPWFEEVAELFNLKTNQYNISVSKDYNDIHECYVTKYGRDEKDTVIFCTINEPSEENINKCLKYIDSLPINFYKIIFAVKNGIKDKQNKKFGGVEVEFRYKKELIDTLVNWKNYREYIRFIFEEKEITDGGKISLKDTYVDLSANKEGDSNIKSTENYIYDWMESGDSPKKHLAILAEYGCGKSVLSLKVTHSILQKENPERIPILIELRGKSPRNLSTTDILSTWASSFRIEPMALMKLHYEGKLVLIFEGFDEMDMVGDKDVRFSHFQKLWEFATPKSKIIITGRPNFFLDQKELKTNLVMEKQYESSHYCEAIYLNKLDREKINLTLRNIDSETKNQVMALINSDSQKSKFFDLVSRPAILYLVSVIWKARKLNLMKNSINSATVIGEFIRYSYSRQSDKKAEFPLKENERAYFMQGAAVGMHKLTDFSNQIDKLNLEDIIFKLYSTFPDGIEPIVSATEAHKNKLKLRLKDNPNAEDMVFTDVRSCGLLVNDLTRKNYFKFAHKSFFDFLISQFFVETLKFDLNDRDSKNVKVIMNTLNVDTSNFRHTQDTINFASEILVNKLDLHEEVKTDKVKVAKKLFDFLYPNKIFSKNIRLAIISESFVGKRPLRESRSFNFFNILLLSTIMFAAYYVWDSYKKHKGGVEVPDIELAMIISLTVVILIFFTSKMFAMSRERIQIWLRCCKQLNITNKDLGPMAPKIFIEYFESDSDEPFPLWYIRKSNVDDDTRIIN